MTSTHFYLDHEIKPADLFESLSKNPEATDLTVHFSLKNPLRVALRLSDQLSSTKFTEKYFDTSKKHLYINVHRFFAKNLVIDIIQCGYFYYNICSINLKYLCQINETLFPANDKLFTVLHEDDDNIIFLGESIYPMYRLNTDFTVQDVERYFQHVGDGIFRDLYPNFANKTGADLLRMPLCQFKDDLAKKFFFIIHLHDGYNCKSPDSEFLMEQSANDEDFEKHHHNFISWLQEHNYCFDVPMSIQCIK